MSNWMPNQNAQAISYQGYGWQQQRLPVYSAAPIHGHDAAYQFPMGANSEIWLPDDENEIIWWIRTDNVGNRSVKPFKLGDYEEPKPVDMNEIVARLAAVEEWINAKQSKPNAKRNVAPTGATASTTTTTE